MTELAEGSRNVDAKALGRTEDASKLKQAVDEIYKGDAIASQLAETVERAAA